MNDVLEDPANMLKPRSRPLQLHPFVDPTTSSVQATCKDERYPSASSERHPPPPPPTSTTNEDLKDHGHVLATARTLLEAKTRDQGRDARKIGYDER